MYKFVLSYSLLFFSYVSYSQCRLTDSLTLVDLYIATDGVNWINQWDLSKPMEAWYGVTLNPQGCVNCIDLDGRLDCSGQYFNNLGNNLIGYIPESIGTLIQLEHLSFGNNFLTGSIPTSLGQLQNLSELIFRYNSLTGNIPPELGNLQNLELLNLTSNELDGELPQEIGSLDYLTFLFIADNNLTGEIPSTFSNLSLLALGASGNNLSGEIPAFLGEIIFWRLYLQDNQFTGCFPHELESLCDLDVNFSNNIELPWQGDFEQFCSGNEQVGAPCEDGLNYTENFIDDHCVCVATITSLSESHDSFFKVFPNPVIDELVILNKDFGNFVYTLYTIEGQKIDNFERQQYNMSHLSSGIYLLSSQNMETPNKNWMKIVKQ